MNNLPMFDETVRDIVAYLEAHEVCPKHACEHTGKRIYLLDFYSYLNEVEKGKALIEHTLSRIVSDGRGRVFYPGRINQRNMSNNVIDCGAAVDCIARFAQTHAERFTETEHARIKAALKEVVDTYLREAAAEKPITNQRLWGLTGLASCAHYAGTDERAVAHKSILRGFSEMLPDGYFRYYPNASHYGTPDSYDDITTCYQSRHMAFARYALGELSMDSAPYEKELERGDRALLSMYRPDGLKDLRMECKRWYFLTPYELASAGFDAYALAHSPVPEAQTALHNLLFQIRKHTYGGYVHSHPDGDINFKCPTFWNAHLAWLVRIPGVEKLYDTADALKSFSFRFEGTEIYTDTTPSRRILINARLGPRNPTTGIYDNGLPEHVHWSFRVPALPERLGFSFRENGNQAYYALIGGSYKEAWLRLWRFVRECVVMLLPRYSTRYGAVSSFRREGQTMVVEVRPATKYGTLFPKTEEVRIPL